jgi:hypothetical protein
MLNAPVTFSGCKWTSDGMYVCAGAPSTYMPAGREGFISSSMMASMKAPQTQVGTGADVAAVGRVKQLSQARNELMDRPMGPIPRVSRMNPDGSPA